jgi:lipopolysaccharide transport system ATP-binding protein
VTPDHTISLRGVGKRYVKYDDVPTLVGQAVRLRHRTRRGQLWALRGVDLDVDAGEAVGVVGRNGAGKSTLLGLLAGVTAPTEGAVTVRGRVSPLLAVGVGFHPELTGRENVYVNGIILGLSRHEIADRFDAIVAFAEVEDFVDTPVKFYSSGMFVRLGFAVSVFAEPDVLLVDEVLAVGDLVFRLRCFERMKQLHEAGTTVIVVSHNLHAIRDLCSRVVVLHDGALEFDGGVDDGLSRYHDLLAGPPVGQSGDGSPAGLPVSFEAAEVLGPDGQPTSHLEAGREACFRFRVRFHETVRDPILGFAVVTHGGLAIYGEATPWADLAPSEAGDVVTFEARMAVRLAGGTYQAVAALRASDGLTDVSAPHPPVLFSLSGRPRLYGVADLEADFRMADDEERRQRRTHPAG